MIEDHGRGCAGSVCDSSQSGADSAADEHRIAVAATILVVDDEAPVRDMLSFWLRRHDFAVTSLASAEPALIAIAHSPPDLVLIDWNLPTMSGIELAARLRSDRATRELALIMLSARATENDRITALDSGVDDYVTKPFAARELLARINAVLRRRRGSTRFADATAVVAVAEPLARLEHLVGVLGPTDARLMRFFMQHPERAHTRAQLRDALWGREGAEERAVDVQVRRLRKALDVYGVADLIQTVWGVGYRFSLLPV